MQADYITTLSRDAQERKGKIRTFTGKYVNPLALRAADICIEDIAHHLSLLCRYTGACPQHYSVGQHSLEVSAGMALRFAGSKEATLAGLLHDASEAYLNDIASPVKHAPLMAEYRRIEHETGKLIFCVFGLDPEWLAWTKTTDDAVFRQEVARFWGTGVRMPLWHPAAVEEEFLKRARELL
jgi:hypothetical protein